MSVCSQQGTSRQASLLIQPGLSQPAKKMFSIAVVNHRDSLVDLTDADVRYLLAHLFDHLFRLVELAGMAEGRDKVSA
jgi:hypothetical protein